MKIKAKTNLETQLSVDSCRKTREAVGPHMAITKYGQNPLNIIKWAQIYLLPHAKSPPISKGDPAFLLWAHPDCSVIYQRWPSVNFKGRQSQSHAKVVQQLI